ncbi:hypothetical protein EON66_10880, partial [archaeon]
MGACIGAYGAEYRKDARGRRGGIFLGAATDDVMLDALADVFSEVHSLPPTVTMNEAYVDDMLPQATVARLEAEEAARPAAKRRRAGEAADDASDDARVASDARRLTRHGTGSEAGMYGRGCNESDDDGGGSGGATSEDDRYSTRSNSSSSSSSSSGYGDSSDGDENIERTNESSDEVAPADDSARPRAMVRVEFAPRGEAPPLS